jgi:hypothetical protein
MQRRHRAAIAATCLALLFPAAALAGSAGDNQYQDPLGNTPSQPKSTTQQATTPPPAPAPTPSATSQPAATTAQTTTTTPSSGTLPRTGLPLFPLAGLGIAFIVGGVLVRRLA